MTKNPVLQKMAILGIVIFAAAALNFELCLSACSRAEYEKNGVCCSKCAPGSHVHLHCTADANTTCVPCPALTYTGEPNGRDKCFHCTKCKAEFGLRAIKSCSRSSDAICEPLEGFFCIDQNKGSCSYALKHSGECHPGQYIEQAGTALSDTVCADCRAGTYSNGSFTVCRPHSDCESEGLEEIAAGTISSDVECGNIVPVALVIGVVAGVIAGVLVTVVGIQIYRKLKQRRQATDERPVFLSTNTTESEGQCEPLCT